MLKVLDEKLYPLDADTENKYWHHKGSGDVFAIRIFGGQIQEVAGPLHYKDVTKVNLVAYNFGGEPEDVAWIKQYEQDFGLCEEPYSGDELQDMDSPTAC